MPAPRKNSRATRCAQDEEREPTGRGRGREHGRGRGRNPWSTESGIVLVRDSGAIALMRDSGASIEGGCSDGEGEEPGPDPVKLMGRMSKNRRQRLAECKEDTIEESQQSHGDVRAGDSSSGCKLSMGVAFLSMGVAFTCTVGLVVLLVGASTGFGKEEDDTGLLAASVWSSTGVGQRPMPPSSLFPPPPPTSPPALSIGEQPQPRPGDALTSLPKAPPPLLRVPPLTGGQLLLPPLPFPPPLSPQPLSPPSSLLLPPPRSPCPTSSLVAPCEGM